MTTRLLLLLLPFVLSACQLLPSNPASSETRVDSNGTAPTASETPHLNTLRQQQLSADAQLFDVSSAQSDVRIHVFRGGLAPTRGKNHVIAVRGLEGFVALHSELPTDAVFALRFALSDLELDPPEMRAETGGSFAQPLTQEQIDGTRDNMLGDSVLNAERHPMVVLQSERIEGDWPILVARVAVTLHGETQPVVSLMTVTRSDNVMVIEGSLVLRQTDFGITPMSVLGGLIGLQDPLAITFHIQATRSVE